MTYREKLSNPLWREKRQSIIERDDNTCRDCGDKEGPFQVHHAFYEKGEPWETSDEFLVTLCAVCHEDRTIEEGCAKRDLGMILASQPSHVRERVFNMLRKASTGNDF